MGALLWAGRAPEGDATSKVGHEGATCLSPGTVPPSHPRLFQLCPQTSWGRGRHAVASCPQEPGGWGPGQALSHPGLGRGGAVGRAAHRRLPFTSSSAFPGSSLGEAGAGVPGSSTLGCSSHGPSPLPGAAAALPFPRERGSCGQVTRCDTVRLCSRVARPPLPGEASRRETQQQ